MENYVSIYAFLIQETYSRELDCDLDTVGASGLSSLPGNDVRSLSQHFAEWELYQCYNLHLERNIEHVAVSPGRRKNIPGTTKNWIDKRAGKINCDHKILHYAANVYIDTTKYFI